MRGDKRGAIEMSVGTIVTIVLAMSMLILGMVLVKNIFSGSTENVLTINDEVKDQINQLFTEDTRTVVYLSNQLAEIEQGEDWGIAFGIQNLESGTANSGSFKYEIVLDDDDAQSKCGISESEIMSWIKTGRTGSATIAPGSSYSGIVRFYIPETAPLCIVRFNLVVTKEDGSAYATDFFDVESTA